MVVFALVAILAVMAFAFLYDAFAWGFVTYKFWYWFILPVFPDLPHVTFWQAVGIALFIGLFKNASQPTVKKEYRDESSVHVMWSAPWIVLLIGWIFSLIIS